MKKLLFGLLASIAWALLGCTSSAQPVVYSQPYIYTDAFQQFAFGFGIDQNKIYNLTFPASVTGPQQAIILANPKFNNFGYSGTNPVITIGPVLPPGSSAGYVSNVITESSNFVVTAAQAGTLFEVTTGGANVTYTLPSPALLPPNFYILVEKVDGSSGNTPTGNVLFNGFAGGTGPLTSQGQMVTLFEDGFINWLPTYQNGFTDAAATYNLQSTGKLSLQPQNTLSSGATANPTVTLGPLHGTGAGIANFNNTGGYVITTTDGGTTADTQASNLILQPGPSTGSAFAGSVTLNAWAQGTSGSTLQATLIQAFTANGIETDVGCHNGNCVFYADDPTHAQDNFVFDNAFNPQSIIQGSRANQTIATEGTIAADNAPAGCIGEFVSSTVAQAAGVTLTTVTPANVTSIALTSGDWDVSCIGAFTESAATLAPIQDTVAVTTSVSSTITVGLNAAQISTQITDFAGTPQDGTINSPLVRISTAVPITVFLTVKSNFSGVGTYKAYGTISARRIR